MVQVHPPKPRSVAQFGRALRSGRRGRWFKSSRSDHRIKEIIGLTRKEEIAKQKEQELNKTLGKDNFYFYTYEHVDFIDNKNKKPPEIVKPDDIIIGGEPSEQGKKAI